MKKNLMMRIASILLVCVLATTCGISGTFAKYVTTGSGSDSARVAKWGVTIADNFSTTFLNEYTKHSSIVGGTDSLSVKSSVDVVAPGTNGSLADFTIAGTPEVDVNVTYVATLDIAGDWLASFEPDNSVDDEYCPLIFTVQIGTDPAKELYIGGTDTEGNAIDNIVELENAVKVAIEKAVKYYDAGSNLALIANDLAVSWRWDFESSLVANKNDYNDTDLGNWELYGNTQPTVTLSIEVTVTQVD